MESNIAKNRKKTREKIMSKNAAQHTPTKVMIVDTLNSVSAGIALPGKRADFAAENISQKPMIGSATTANDKVLSMLKDKKIPARLPAENRIMPTKNKEEAPKLCRSRVNPDGSPCRPGAPGG